MAKRSFGGYACEESVAIGLYGETFRARNKQGAQARVLVVDPQLSKRKEFASGLAKYGANLKELIGEHIVTTKMVGKGKDGSLVVISSAVHKEVSLDRFLKATPEISEDISLRISLGVLKGLKRAHDKGVIHGGLHPESILMDSKGGVKLADFGLARALSALDEKQYSSLYAALGRYQAPEVREGNAATIESDVFAAGALISHLLWKVTTPPSDACFEIAAVLQKATRKDLKQRFASAAKLDSAFRTAIAEAQLQVANDVDVRKWVLGVHDEQSSVGTIDTDLAIPALSQIEDREEEEATQELQESKGGVDCSIEAMELESHSDPPTSVISLKSRSLNGPEALDFKGQGQEVTEVVSDGEGFQPKSNMIELANPIDDGAEEEEEEEEETDIQKSEELLNKEQAKAKAKRVNVVLKPTLAESYTDETTEIDSSLPAIDSAPATRSPSKTVDKLKNSSQSMRAIRSSQPRKKIAVPVMDDYGYDDDTVLPAPRPFHADGTHVGALVERVERQVAANSPFDDDVVLPEVKVDRFANLRLVAIIVFVLAVLFAVAYTKTDIFKASKSEKKTENELAATLSEKQQPQAGTLVIEASEEDAAVWLLLGRTPSTSFPLSSSMVHEIRVDQEGYKTAFVAVGKSHWSEQGETRSAEATVLLEAEDVGKASERPAFPPVWQTKVQAGPRGQGPVIVRSQPEGAEVWLWVGTTPTAQVADLEAGKEYEFKILKDGYQPNIVVVRATEWYLSGSEGPIHRVLKRSIELRALPKTPASKAESVSGDASVKESE